MICWGLTLQEAQAGRHCTYNDPSLHMHVLRLTASWLTVKIKGAQIILEYHNQHNRVQVEENNEVNAMRRLSSESESRKALFHTNSLVLYKKKKTADLQPYAFR